VPKTAVSGEKNWILENSANRELWRRDTERGNLKFLWRNNEFGGGETADSG
jgi:hypothetical protein